MTCFLTIFNLVNREHKDMVMESLRGPIFVFPIGCVKFDHETDLVFIMFNDNVENVAKSFLDLRIIFACMKISVISYSFYAPQILFEALVLCSVLGFLVQENNFL
jgi:hypothetical protein